MLPRISNSILDHPHRWALAVFFGALAFIACAEGVPALRSLAAAPATIAAAAAPIPGQIANQVLAQTVPMIDKHAGLVRRDLFGEVKTLRVETAKQITALRGDVMPLAYGALGVVNQARGDAVRQIEGIRADLKPTLDNSAALVKDAQDSWDDLYWDTKAMIGSATVAVTSAGQSADAISRAVPRFLLLGQEIAQNLGGVTDDVHGITTDLHKVTTKFTAPKTRAQKAWGVAETVLLLGARVAVAR